VLARRNVRGRGSQRAAVGALAASWSAAAVLLLVVA
jgi:hypothetical protein